MNALYLTLAYLHVFISIFLVLLIIIQRTTGNGLFTTSQSNPFMSGAEITNFITKLTTFFIVLFFVNTLVLARISYISNAKKKDILSQQESQVLDEKTSVPVLN